MDQELIRKAAEALHESWKCQLSNDGLIPIPEWAGAFKNLPTFRSDELRAFAEAALTVFYEHTRAQPREGRGVRCQDCGAAMHPMPGSLGKWGCWNCGKSV